MDSMPARTSRHLGIGVALAIFVLLVHSAHAHALGAVHHWAEPAAGPLRASAAMAYRFGPFSIDSESRVLRRGSGLIPLTARGFDLLALLVRERPKAIKKDDLIKALWPDSFVADGSLAQLVTEALQRSAAGSQAPRRRRKGSR